MAAWQRQLKFQRLPICIQDHVKEDLLLWGLGAECQAVRPGAPVRLSEFYAMAVLGIVLKNR